MDQEQELEWDKAQKIAISEDLLAAAKQQLRFLAEVDKHQQLYDGPALQRAIYRYKYYWLPLLAKHAKSPVSQGPLVVPLDCEWIWHCHRLNPVRYKKDCEELFGRILGNQNVASSTQATCKKQTEQIWNRMYANEPYELNISTKLAEDFRDLLAINKSTTYDLVSAIKRQSSFYYQVSRPHVNDDTFLKEAVARYKGFLHLIKTNQERSIRCFCVPTYDIDLIWHSHQLHPVSYCKDLAAIIGRVLEHDDTDSDRTKGKKLDIGFSLTTKRWEETFGSRYWKAGTMHRGSTPSPLNIKLSELDAVGKKVVAHKKYESMIQLHKKKLVEVMLEIVGIRDLPAGHKGSLFVVLSKKHPDLLFYGKRRLSILSEAGEKQVAVFECEPIGELVCELVSHSSSALHISKPFKTLGMASISLQDIMKQGSPLSVDKWFELVPNPGIVVSKPIKMRIALSFTPSVQAPFLLRLVQTHLSSTSFSFPISGRFQQGKSWTCIVDESGNEMINLQMRDSMKVEAKGNCFSKKEVIGMTTSNETHVLAEFDGTGWSLINSSWWFQLQKKFRDVGYFFELTGSHKIIIFPGKKLDYEINNCEKHKNEQNLTSAVEFSVEYPSGKAAALFDLKSGFLKINEEWLVFPGILLAFLLSDTLSKEGYNAFSTKGESPREMDIAAKDNQDDHRSTKLDATEIFNKMDWKCSRQSAQFGNCGAMDGSEATVNSVMFSGVACSECDATCGQGDTVKSYSYEGPTACHGGCGGSCRGSCGGGCRGGCSACHGDCGYNAANSYNSIESEETLADTKQALPA